MPILLNFFLEKSTFLFIFAIMKSRCLYIVALLAVGASSTWAREWKQDILGDGFESTVIDQGEDYAGPVVSTVIRHKSDCPQSARRAILYVHGYNDYFFQDEMARRFADSCWNFYAVDLRKYGRSILPDNKRFQARDMREYFADIDSALSVMREDGIEEVALMGHSTGGLTTSLYMAEKPDTIVKTLILNSPFLDWNQSKLNRNVLIPAMEEVAAIAPQLEISQGDNNSYSHSLLSRYNGEWDYNTDWKLEHSQNVETSWLRAIDEAQSVLQDAIAPVKVPVLLMHSDKSSHPKSWNEECNRTDVVLDVDDISRVGRKLSANVTEATVKGGIHDLMLSSEPVRNAVYSTVAGWLDRTMPNYRAYTLLYKK